MANMPANRTTVDKEATTTCYYCGLCKVKSEFSDEHIWPDALGGDFLAQFWRTTEVCAKCNSMSGVFVDGAFIRGWAGSAERGHDARLYLSPKAPLSSILPLSYLGKLKDPNINTDEVADWWAGPCGATIVHFRPKESEEIWSTFVGGDPRAKKTKAGRAYIAFASANEYWIIAALNSFKQHFKRARRFVVNMTVPPEWAAFKEVDRNDPNQCSDLKVIDAITDAAKASESIGARQQIQIDADHRFLCKLGLAIGCKIFGTNFGGHEHGDQLRRAFREANPDRRKKIPIRGSSYFDNTKQNPLAFFAWPAGWVLMVQTLSGTLSLTVVAPSGKSMVLAITDDPKLIGQLSAEYADGMVWVTVPPLAKAVGPLPIPEYVAHLTRSVPNPDLGAFETAIIDPSTLPPC